MNTAFGTLVRNRRRNLCPPQALPTQCMAGWGQAVNIGPLENGKSVMPDGGTITALDPTLRLPVGILAMAGNGNPARRDEPATPSQSDDADTVDHRNREQFIEIQEDLAALRDLYITLQQRVDDLEARIQTVQFDD